jgi:hypothetical protein
MHISRLFGGCGGRPTGRQDVGGMKCDQSQADIRHKNDEAEGRDIVDCSHLILQTSRVGLELRYTIRRRL